MTNVGQTINGIAGVFGRGFRQLRGGPKPDLALDPYEPVPLNRTDMVALFELDRDSPHSQAESLRASERLERDSMSIIRSALYPAK